MRGKTYGPLRYLIFLPHPQTAKWTPAQLGFALVVREAFSRVFGVAPSQNISAAQFLCEKFAMEEELGPERTICAVQEKLKSIDDMVVTADLAGHIQRLRSRFSADIDQFVSRIPPVFRIVAKFSQFGEKGRVACGQIWSFIASCFKDSWRIHRVPHFPRSHVFANLFEISHHNLKYPIGGGHRSSSRLQMGCKRWEMVQLAL